MTTATDWQPATWTDTGELARVTDVTSAATPGAPVRVGGWTPGPNNRPDHIHDDLCRKVQPAEYADEPTPQAGVAPDTADITKRIDLQLASYRLMRHQETKAELWRAEANRMWAEQGVTSRISEHYTDRREALLSAYEAESRRLLDGLDHAPYTAYVAALPEFVRGITITVVTEQHTSVYSELAPDRIHADDQTPPQPADRSDVEALARRDKERRQREQRALTTGEQPAQAEPPRVGGWRVWAASAAIGIVGLAATIGALVVWA